MKHFHRFQELLFLAGIWAGWLASGNFIYETFSMLCCGIFCHTALKNRERCVVFLILTRKEDYLFLACVSILAEVRTCAFQRCLFFKWLLLRMLNPHIYDLEYRKCSVCLSEQSFCTVMNHSNFLVQRSTIGSFWIRSGHLKVPR